jgi:predicted nucleic acid-binding protein
LNYIDTSVLVAALVRETHTRRAERLLTGGSDGDLATSDWTLAEFSSALSIKLRVGGIDMEGRKAALEALAVMLNESIVLLPVERAQFRLAARYADQHQVGLRAPDALHLAVAAERGATLCTLDQRLAAAGKSLGVATRLI